MTREEAFDMAIEALSADAVHKPDYSYEADAEAVQDWIPGQMSIKGLEETRNGVVILPKTAEEWFEE